MLYWGQSPTLDVVFGGVQVLGEGCVIPGACTGGREVLYCGQSNQLDGVRNWGHGHGLRF